MNRWSWEHVSFEELLGKTLVEIDETVSDELAFVTSDGDNFLMYHGQDCCESVYIEDITGDLVDLIGSPITMAEEVTEEGSSEWGSYTWTFYKLATVKGYVTIRWLGESNGYYSESVDFARIPKDEIYG